MGSLFHTFSTVRRHEVLPVVLAALFFFCVLTALMVVRPAREALGMQRGIEAVRWLFLGTLLLALLVNPVFGWLASRLRRSLLVGLGYGFFALGLLVFHGLLVLTPQNIGQVSGMVFYVWFSVFNLFATMLFWACMADRFTPDESERLFGAIAVGGTLGALFGPWLAGQLVAPLGTAGLLPVAAVFLVLAAGFSWLVARQPRSPGAGQGRIDDGMAVGGGAWDGLRSVWRSPYLLGIAAYALLVAIVATLLYFTRLQMVAELALDTDTRAQAFARIDFYTQLGTLVLQALITGHLMHRLGVGVALALLPVVVALGFAGLAVAGTLAALIALEATFKAVQRGIMRPARETLFTVLPRDERYKAKAFIDTFVYRGGDAVGAQTEGMLGRLGMGLAGLAAFAVPLAIVWGALGIWLGLQQRTLKKGCRAAPD